MKKPIAPTKPFLPVKLSEPKKEILFNSRESFYQCSVYDGEIISLKDIFDKVKNISKEIITSADQFLACAEIQINAESYEGSESYGSGKHIYLEFLTTTPRVGDNLNYQAELRTYYKNIKIYNKQEKKYKLDLEKYKILRAKYLEDKKKYDQESKIKEIKNLQNRLEKLKLKP